MTKTILITGTSSGYGKATAEHFLSRGWNVVATMRRPDPSLFAETDRLRVLPLDVTSPESIAELIGSAGSIDLLVNNAGIGGVGAFEAMPMSLIRQLVETNTIGVMAMCQAVIPQMRERRSGTIINVTSSVTLGEFPLAAAYTATKQAIEGFSASLAHEPRLFWGPREAHPARLCTNHPVRGKCHCSCLGAPSWRICRLRTANSRGVRESGPDHHGKRCCRSSLAGRSRYRESAPLPCWSGCCRACSGALTRMAARAAVAGFATLSAFSVSSRPVVGLGRMGITLSLRSRPCL